MIPPRLPDNEKRRQLEVNKYQILDTIPESSYDNITALMAYICDAPISLITLLDKDRNFLKSHYGLAFNESPREISFCGHAINSQDPITIVEDSRKDERFHDNPLVTEHQAIFYAGAPLTNSEGFKLGTLCVYDTKPRKLTKEQKNALITMAQQVTSLFEQRYQNFLLLKYQKELKKRNEELRKFAKTVSHDLKSPLSNIISLTEFLNEENEGKLSEESQNYIEYLRSSSQSLKNYVDGLLQYYKNDALSEKRFELISVNEIFNELQQITDSEREVKFTLKGNSNAIFTDKSALLQIMINLITNAIKYNHKGNPEIEINFSENEQQYNLHVADNGDGIPKELLNKVFDPFSIVGIEDKDGKMGSGIGLASVKKITENLGGIVNVDSTLGVGSTFSITIPK
jgi:signal transduction histidine kinase